jgi:hypothetical protein
LLHRNKLANISAVPARREQREGAANMDEDHLYLEERIREARRLRAEAAGELFAAAWEALRRAANGISHAIVGQLRSHHILHH